MGGTREAGETASSHQSLGHRFATGSSRTPCACGSILPKVSYRKTR